MIYNITPQEKLYELQEKINSKLDKVLLYNEINRGTSKDFLSFYNSNSIDSCHFICDNNGLEIKYLKDDEPGSPCKLYINSEDGELYYHNTIDGQNTSEGKVLYEGNFPLSIEDDEIYFKEQMIYHDGNFPFKWKDNNDLTILFPDNDSDLIINYTEDNLTINSENITVNKNLQLNNSGIKIFSENDVNTFSHFQIVTGDTRLKNNSKNSEDKEISRQICIRNSIDIPEHENSLRFGIWEDSTLVNMYNIYHEGNLNLSDYKKDINIMADNSSINLQAGGNIILKGNTPDYRTIAVDSSGKELGTGIFESYGNAVCLRSIIASENVSGGDWSQQRFIQISNQKGTEDIKDCLRLVQYSGFYTGTSNPIITHNYKIIHEGNINDYVEKILKEKNLIN